MTESETPRRPALRFGPALDPLLGMLWTLVFALGVLSVLQRPPQPVATAASAGLPARLAEVQAFALELRPGLAAGRPRVAKGLTQPWDRAVGAILAAEGKDSATARSLALEGPEPAGPGAAFRDLFRAAYEGGPLPPPGREAAVSRALGNGFAARLLEARLLDRAQEPARAQALRESARRAMGTRFAGFAVLGFTVLALLAAGIAFGAFLIVTRKVPPRLELGPSALDGRNLAWAFGLWLLVLFLSGSLAGTLTRLLQPLQPATLFLAYSLHAGTGVALLAALEGRGLKGVLGRLGTRSPLRALGWAAGFLALAVALVVGVALVMAPLLKNAQPPQRELMDMIRGSRGLLPTLLLFITMAGLAPCFEELMFRGTLLPWLQTRLGPSWAIPLSALAFAAIHLQPLALPTLFTLGAVLGLAARRTGSLLAPIAVHAAWNGSVFLLMRILA